MAGLPSFSSVNYQHVAAVKAALALAAAALLAWWWYAERTERPGRPTWRQLALATIGVLSLLAWWNFGRFHFGGGYVHYHEFFHYYLNSKYLSELGYTGLYDCVALAEIEAGRRLEVEQRWIRDLSTNELGRGSPVLDDPALCRARFASPSRWNAFTTDVAWFRTHMNDRKWIDVLTDHGYNATPVWSIAGGWLSNTGPASDTQILWLTFIDAVLLVVMWALVWWAFGWQVLCVALIWWGTNYPARYNYVGGAFLRQDWLLLAVASICFARRRWMAASGFCLTWSALLRIFPAFIAVGLLLKIVFDAWGAKRLKLAPDHVRFAAGALVALALLVPTSQVVAKSDTETASPWIAFAENSRKLLSTPLTNHIGLPVVLSFSPSSRAQNLKPFWLDSPWDVWKDARRRLFAERRVIFAVLILGFVCLLGAAVRSLDDWEALVLGVGAIPVFTQLTGYYYSVLLVYAFFWPRIAPIGIGLPLLALSTGVTTAVLTEDDDRYTVISAMILLFVAAATWLVARHARRRAPDTLRGALIERAPHAPSYGS